jgi:hypothetical protein
MYVEQQSLTDAETIRENAEAAYARVRNRGELTPAAIATLLARTYVDAKAQMEALAQRSGADVAAKSRRLYQSAFGIDDIAGNNGVDRASASVSYRDAQDRVASLESPVDAGSLLTRAENSGDELLARAIAQRAFDQAPMDAGWGELLDRYLASRPKAVQAVSDLLDMRTKPSVAAMFAFIISTPPELAGLAEYQIQALAADRSLV